MDETFNTFHRVLSFAGISIFAKQKWDSQSWLCLQIFNFIIGVLCFIFTTGFVAVKYSDFLLWIEGACIWTTGVIMSITLGVCLFFRKDFRVFLNEMAFKDGMLKMPLIEYLLTVPRDTPKLRELKELVVESQEKLLKYTRVLLKTYVACVFICATLYLCKPIYQMIIREDESLRLLAFEMWFPWSLKNMNVYIISLIFNVYSAYLCCIGIINLCPLFLPEVIGRGKLVLTVFYPYPGLQSTIILLVSQVIRQLKILSFILLHLNELVLELTTVQDERWQVYCTIVLSQCIDHYVKLKRFSNKLNVICRPFYLTLILVSIMLVCVCSVKIAISSKFSPDTMKYYFHEICFILVVLSFCLLGQQVENECEALNKVVTEKWYIFNRTHKTNVRIFTMALNQRMPIYIFGTITLSLPTFTWFLKTGMSFFTLVMSVLDEAN